MLRRARVAVPLALALAACSEEQVERPPPTDRFYYPIGLATARIAGGTEPALLVASSNFDLRYAVEGGGTLLAVDPDASVGGGPLDPLSARRIGSYAGPVVVADADRCAGISSPAVLVASRLDDTVLRFDLGDDGALTCGAGCVHGAPGRLDDPYAIGLACGPMGRYAYVGWLDPPLSTDGDGDGAWIAELDLDDPAAPLRAIELGDGPARGLAYDDAGDRLWVTTRSSDERALLHSVPLADPRWRGSDPGAAAETVDLFAMVRGVELRAIAVGTAPAAGVTRLYATARAYDVEAQIANGYRPAGDIDGLLLVLDAFTGDDGRQEVVLRRRLSIGLGIGELAVMPRAGQGDLVAVTATDDVVAIYDDDVGAVVRELRHDPLTGAPVAGDRPLALAVDFPSPSGGWWVYVASFGDHLVTRFEVDPAAPGTPGVMEQIGGLKP